MRVDINNLPKPTIKFLDSKGLHLSENDEKIMNKCIMQSELVYYGKVDDEIACVWGVIPPTLMSDQAYIWMYASELVREHQFIFIRKSQLAIEKLLKSYGKLVGFTRVDATKTIKWLRWLGAEFGYPSGMNIPFEIRKK